MSTSSASAMSSLLFFLFINFNCIFEDVLIGCIRCNRVFGANLGSIAGFRLGLYLCSAVYNRALGPFDFCAAGWTCHRCPFHVVELCVTLSAKVFPAPLWFCQCVPLILRRTFIFRPFAMNGSCCQRKKSIPLLVAYIVYLC